MIPAGTDGQGTEGDRGAAAEPSTHAAEPRGGPPTTAAPDENHEPWQTTRDVKSSHKRHHAAKAKYRDRGRSSPEVAGQEEISLVTKTLRDQDGDGSTGLTRRSRRRRHTKGGKMARGRSKGSKTPEDTQKPESLTSAAQHDGKPAESAVAAKSGESGPAQRATSPGQVENVVEGVKAGSRRLADGSPEYSRVSPKAHEGPPEVPKSVSEEHFVASSSPGEKPAEESAVTTEYKANEHKERRKSKVAIVESVPESWRNETLLVGRRPSRRPSQISRKDSTIWSARKSDASWLSLASTALSRAVHMARRRSPRESQESELDPEKQVLLAAVGCALLLAFGGILAGIAYVMLRARIGSAGVACVTPECRRAKAYLAGLLNLGWDTCTGFYQYVCSSWTSGNSSFAEDVGDALAIKLHDALLADTATRDRLGKHVAAETYRACHKYAESETTFEEVFQYIRDVLNIPGILRAKSFPELMENFLRTSLTFGFSSVMNINFVNVSDENVIVYISVGKSLLSKLADSDESHLERTLTQILSSSPVSDDAKETVANLVNLDAELTLLLRERQDRDDTQALRKFLDGLVPGVEVDTWLSAMNGVSKHHLSADNIAVGRGINSVRRCFEKLGMSGLKMAATYLAVSLQVEVAAIERQKHLAAESKPRTIRFCLGLSQRAVAVTWHRIVTELAAIAEAGDALVHDVFRALQRTSDDASVFSWLRQQSRQAATKVVHETSLTTGYHGWAAAEEPAAAYGSYALTFGDPRHFVVDYMEALKEGQEARFQAPPTWTELTLSTLDPLGVVVYDPSLKLVALPAVFLTEPLLYATGVPMYYNYAIVGAVLASQLAAAVGQSSELEVDAEGHPEPGRLPRRNVTSTCLRRLHEKLGFGKNVSGSAQEQDDAMFALAQGVVLAHASLAANFEASAPDQETYDSLWPEAQTTFFLRFCLWSCSASQHPSPLTPMERCLLPMHNMPAFADTFGCTNRSDFVKGDCRM